MKAFIDSMYEREFSGMDDLHRSVSELVLTEFPDHTNVGDSAIALGEFAYWRKRGIVVSGVYSYASLKTRVFNSEIPVAIHGGGNIGGLYPVMEDRRLDFARLLPPETILIQLPQSVVFVSSNRQAAFVGEFGSRVHSRIGIRDQPSFEAVKAVGQAVRLVPDAVHILGVLPSRPATERALIVKRTDAESADSLVPARLNEAGAYPVIDWPRGSFYWRVKHKLKYESTFPRLPRGRLQKSPEAWEARARQRFELGVELLSTGEVIVTDRLHAMLMGLQMGRRVIAIDNSNSKLSNYARTWFNDLNVPLDFADSFTAGVEMADRRML